MTFALQDMREKSQTLWNNTSQFTQQVKDTQINGKSPLNMASFGSQQPITAVCWKLNGLFRERYSELIHVPLHEEHCIHKQFRNIL